MKTIPKILLVLAFLLAGVTAFGQQQNIREATVAEVTAGTLGLPAVITPRRLNGWGGGGDGGTGGTGGGWRTSSGLGFVTKNSHGVPDFFNGGAATFGTRAAYVAANLITNIEVAYPNFYGPAETPSGGNAIVTAAIEYPAGTINQLLFAGASRGTIPNGQYIISDLKKLSVAIPPGATFWVRSYYTNAVGILYFNNLEPEGFYTTSLYGAAVPDLTTSTGPIGVADSVGYYPMAVIGNYSGPSILTIGDSRDVGTFSENTTPLNSQKGIDMVVGNYYGLANMSVAGQTLNSSIINRRQFAKFATHIVSDLGFNGFDDATIVNLKSNWCKQFTNPVIAETITPQTTSSDNWSTLAGQTPNFGFTNFNTKLRAGLVPYVSLCLDVAGVNESSLNSGKWAVNGTTNWLTVDGVHGRYYTRLAHYLGDVLHGNTLANLDPVLIPSPSLALNTTNSANGNAITGWYKMRDVNGNYFWVAGVNHQP